MRIIAFVNNNSGPSYHRIIMPLMLMEDADVYITNNLDEKDFEKGCDMLMYNRILPDHAMDKIRELQRQHGFKICVDIDDYWELHDNHILNQNYQDEGFAQQQVQHIQDADVVLTTHDRLADEIRPYNENVHVCPNAIPKQGQFNIERTTYHLTRLFWQGSITHQQDIQILQRPIESLGHISGKIKMVMGGYTEDEEAWHRMALDYTANSKCQYKLIPPEPVTNYYSLYKHADICLVPLVNNLFNRMKSNLKILEAANLGLPVIASAVHPYLDMPVSYCRNSKDWIGHIKRLVQWPARRKEEGERLAEFCSVNYNFHKINETRKQILEYEGSKQGVTR